MPKYRVNTNRHHFERIKHIALEIETLASFFQNDGMVITDEDWEEFNHRYLEVTNKLESWHSESLSRFQKLNLEDD
ncbi:hypothetical protein M3638_03015 [Oceanobacillus profundus]|uniref:hypothetical protein n=1 Tax=Oceanobacillus profundus TaxID=372463 RepID=UPI00204038B2|nr:hypothetical protein [Oceanobacillus profundus]MCM3396810.1 hypothetical protein [Oceanobacillus profundus]